MCKLVANMFKNNCSLYNTHMSGMQKKTYRVNMGKWGEERACAFLEEKGFTIIARNVRSPYGEIDLIVSGDGKIHFVEVKTRSTSDNGFPEEAVTEQKMQHLDANVRSYLEQHPEISDNWQMDVITVIGRPNADVQPIIDWWCDEL
jgi:putative endonuclease